MLCTVCGVCLVKGAWLQSEVRVECTWSLVLMLVLVFVRVVNGGWMA